MYMKKMKQEANNRNENISILINKYQFGCQEAMKNPPKEIVEVLKSRVDEEAKQNDKGLRVNKSR